MCKLMERVIRERLVAYIEGNRLTDPTQEGFRKNHYTTNALLRLVQSIVDGFNKDECTLAWLEDLEEAYDSIWHNGETVQHWYQRQNLEMDEQLPLRYNS